MYSLLLRGEPFFVLKLTTQQPGGLILVGSWGGLSSVLFSFFRCRAVIELGGVPFSLKTGPVFPQYMYLTLYQGVFLVFVAVLRRSTTYQRCVVYYTEDALIRVDTLVIRA